MSGLRHSSAFFAVVCLVGAGVPSGAHAREPTWVEVGKLVAEDAAGGDELGLSVALFGDTAVVGTWLDDDLGGSSGAAYVFERHEGGTDAGAR